MAKQSLPKEHFTDNQRKAAARFWTYVNITTDSDYDGLHTMRNRIDKLQQETTHDPDTR